MINLIKFLLISWVMILSANAQVSINCTPLNLGSFVLEFGIDSASDFGRGRVGVQSFQGQESDCTISGPASTPLLVTVNNENSRFVLNGNGQTFNADIRIENNGNNLGVRNEFVIPTGSTSTTFKIDASVPSGQSISGGGIFSSNIVIDVSYN